MSCYCRTYILLPRKFIHRINRASSSRRCNSQFTPGVRTGISPAKQAPVKCKNLGVFPPNRAHSLPPQGISHSTPNFAGKLINNLTASPWGWRGQTWGTAHVCPPSKQRPGPPKPRVPPLPLPPLSKYAGRGRGRRFSTQIGLKIGRSPRLPCATRCRGRAPPPH